MEDKIYDVVIIGGGPAGLTAGLYSVRARLKTLLIESPSVAAQAVVTALIENYPGFPEGIVGFDLINKMRNHAQNFGLEISEGEVIKIEKGKSGGIKTWKVILTNKQIGALSVIIATGAQPKTLGIPGEEKFKGKGVSYCAVCDGALFKDKDIVVVGGGDTALDEALFLARFAKSIKLVHRRDRLRGTKILQERIFSEKKIEVVFNSVAEEVVGKTTVEGIKIKNTVSDEKNILPCAGVFIFVGYMPNTGFMKGLVNMDEDGYVITDANMRTSEEGIFACGDCRQKLLKQVITACGDGATAAFSSQLYVEKIKGVSYNFRKVV